MSQGQACMPFHSSPAQSQTTQSPLEKLKFNANIWKLRQNTKFKNAFSLWESHLNWNLQMLQCPTFSNRVLSTLKFHTNQSKDLVLHSKSKGFIYAMIHLRTNKFFVIATQKTCVLHLNSTGTVHILEIPTFIGFSQKENLEMLWYGL